MSAVANERLVDLRCPVGARRLLARMIQQGDSAHVDEWNLLELLCRDCCKRLRQENPEVRLVVHRFNVLGELVESVVREN